MREQRGMLPDILLALLRTLGTLSQPRVWLLMVGPAVLAVLVWGGLAWYSLDALIALFASLPPMTWLAGWGADWLAELLAALGGWAVILTAAYLTAILLAAVFILPLLLAVISGRDYPDVAARGRDSFFASAWNSVSALGLFIVAWILTLPLWLIPGAGLILPLLLLAWLNRRTFAYDALAVHATDDEWRMLQRTHATPFLLLGVLLALAGHVPLFGLMVPTIAAIAYIHYGLENLRRLRSSGGGVIIEGERL